MNSKDIITEALKRQYTDEDVHFITHQYKQHIIQEYTDSLDNAAIDEHIDVEDILNHSTKSIHHLMNQVLQLHAYGPITTIALIHNAYIIGSNEEKQKNIQYEEKIHELYNTLIHRYIDMLEHTTPDHRISKDLHPAVLNDVASHLLRNNIHPHQKAKWVGYIQAALIAHNATTLKTERKITTPLYPKDTTE